jgi:hypothetical protein
MERMNKNVTKNLGYPRFRIQSDKRFVLLLIPFLKNPVKDYKKKKKEKKKLTVSPRKAKNSFFLP